MARIICVLFNHHCEDTTNALQTIVEHSDVVGPATPEPTAVLCFIAGLLVVCMWNMTKMRKKKKS